MPALIAWIYSCMEPTVGQLIKQTQTAQGKTIEIWHSEQLAMSEAMLPFLQAYTEVLEKGWATLFFPWNESNKFGVVYAKADGKVVSGIAYEYRQVLREGWVLLSFTHPDYRGQHLNEIVHGPFEAIMREKGALKLASHIHQDNTSALKSAERVGRVPVFYRLQKNLT